MNRNIYDLLIERAHTSQRVRRLLLGMNWSVAELDACGLCYSPAAVSRTLSWSGTLTGRPASSLTHWVRSLAPAEAAVGAAVINAVVNSDDNTLLRAATPLEVDGPAHLAVFKHFEAMVAGAAVVVIGRYPGLDRVWNAQSYVCLERHFEPGTVPESAARAILERADWVFVTASALANKSLPGLLRLSRRAKVVLMGPSTPWLAEWADFGVDFLAGVALVDANELFRVASEGGGTRIFDHSVQYRVIRLG